MPIRLPPIRDVPCTEFQRAYASIVESAATNRNMVYVTKHGIRVAVVISIDLLDQLVRIGNENERTTKISHPISDYQKERVGLKFDDDPLPTNWGPPTDSIPDTPIEEELDKVPSNWRELVFDSADNHNCIEIPVSKDGPDISAVHQLIRSASANWNLSFEKHFINKGTDNAKIRCKFSYYKTDEDDKP